MLKWSKNPDGSPRAKARLIVRGYADRDALEGKLATAAPTTSRLSRSIFLSVSSSFSWIGWTANVSTAFLQGLPQERSLWVKLLSDALAILGAPADTRMFLINQALLWPAGCASTMVVGGHQETSWTWISKTRARSLPILAL